MPEDHRILHSRLVVRGSERYGLINQHDGEHVLDTDIRHLPVVDYRCPRVHTHDDFTYLIGVQRFAFQHGFESVQRRLYGCADGPLLNAGADDLVALAELIHERVRITVRSVGEQEIVVAGKDVIDPGPA